LAQEVPSVRLGQAGALGQTTWLWTRPLKADPDQYTYTHVSV
jgi:predicted component of type VI protein secretion system